MSNLEELLERLRLSGFKKALHEELQQAQQTGCALSQSLLRLLTAEYAHRQQQSMLYRLSQAKIPFDWSLESFPFKKQPAVNKKQIIELAELSFIATAHNVVLIGDPGTGKTGLAIGLLRKALIAGYRGRFYNAQDLLDELYSSLADRSTNRLIHAIYGLRFVAHGIGHADRSAVMERNFRYIENSFLPGQNFTSWSALNAAARRFCDEIANSKIKRALGMSPRQAYANERPFLKPLPAVKPPVYQALSRTVDLYGYVTVDTNRYSVPEALCGKQVEIHKGLYHLRIFYRMRRIATHPRLIEQRDSKSTLPGHHSPPVAHKTNKHLPLLQKLLGHSPELNAYVKKIAARPAATRHLQRLLALKRDYPAQAFDSAIARGLQYGVYDLSRLEKLVLRVVAGEFFKLGESENE